MPVNIAHKHHKKIDTRSDFERALEATDGDRQAVMACPEGCKEEDQDALGCCEHLFGYTNANVPDGDVKAVPAGAVVEVLSQKRDKTKRRVMEIGANGEIAKVPLKVGDHCIRVNGVTRRVYRKIKKSDTAPTG